MSIMVREFAPTDYDQVMALWRTSTGIVLRDVDAREPLCAYLLKNAGLSFVAVHETAIVGAVLCGTDGRRGYLQHLAVRVGHQRQGVGRRLVDASMAALHARGIQKCHLMVLDDNLSARGFWSRLGWVDRTDIRLMSHTARSAPTA